MPIDHTALLRDLFGYQPFRAQDAMAAGISRSALRAAVAGGRLIRVRHGVLQIPSGVGGGDGPDYLTRIAALARSHEDLVFSHHTAAHLLGIPMLHGTPTIVHGYHSAPRRMPGVFRHRGRLGRQEIVEHNGVLVTSPWRTAIDLALIHPFAAALMGLDHVLRQRTIALADQPDLPDDEIVELQNPVKEARAELTAHVRSAARRHGVARLRDVAEWASPLAESPAESYSRGQMISYGMPPLSLQYRVIDGHGTRRRLDFLLAPGLAGECDGLVKYDGPDGREHLRKEKSRDLALAAIGLDTLRWSPIDMLRQPDVVMIAIQSRMRLHSTKSRAG